MRTITEQPSNRSPRKGWRSRWAAVGAATGVVLDVTVVDPQANGFMSVRPTGTPGPTTHTLIDITGSSTPASGTGTTGPPL